MNHDSSVKERVHVKRIVSFFFVLLLPLTFVCLHRSARGEVSDDITVGTELSLEDITDFYYTYDAPLAMSRYQRYRFYVEDGKHFFYHETREGGAWPLTEEYISDSGMVELNDGQWDTFCSYLAGGTARKREESLDTGDAGPWLFIYWNGGEKEGREFYFENSGTVLAFEAFCESVREEHAMKIRVSDGTHTVIYELNSSIPAKSLYSLLPFDAEVENYGDNEKIFYPPQEIDARNGIEGSGAAGDLALFSPWGNVVMFYGDFGAYPGLYILGRALEGAQEVSNLSGTVHAEAEGKDRD